MHKRMVKGIALSVVVLFVFGMMLIPFAFGGTGNSGDPVYNLALCNSTRHKYDKCFYQFNLPSLGGGTFVSATFHGAVGGSVGSLAISTSIFVSENVTWNESSAIATMQSLSMLGAATATFNLTPGVTTTFTADVTGTTNGVKQAYLDGKTAVTILLQGPALTENITDATDLSLGDDTADQVTLTTRTSALNKPYLEIAYTGGGGGGGTLPHKVRINGI